MRSRLEALRFGLRAYVTVLLVTVPLAKWALTDIALPEWAVAGMLGSATAAGGFEAWKKATNNE